MADPTTPAEAHAPADTHAGTEAPGAAHHPEPKALGLDATVWVALAMVCVEAVELVVELGRVSVIHATPCWCPQRRLLVIDSQ